MFKTNKAQRQMAFEASRQLYPIHQLSTYPLNSQSKSYIYRWVKVSLKQDISMGFKSIHKSSFCIWDTKFPKII